MQIFTPSYKHVAQAMELIYDKWMENEDIEDTPTTNEPT